VDDVQIVDPCDTVGAQLQRRSCLQKKENGRRGFTATAAPESGQLPE
jgi:hypothetical protein